MNALRPLLGLAAVGFALALAGCTTTPPPQSATSVTSETIGGCALGVSGALATADDTPDGVALTILSANRLDEVRVRARDAATLHGPDSRQGLGHDGHHAEGGKHGLQPAQLPPARASATDIDGGARIELVPVDAADLERLRSSIRARANAMNLRCE